MDTFWRKQEKSKPLFPDVEWNRPERRDQAGRLGIVGGNKLGFAAVATSYQAARDAGAGEVRVLLPDTLRRTVPAAMTDVLFAPTNPSGGLSGAATSELAALGEWANVMLLIGDAGKNSETAALYEQFVRQYHRPAVLSRDAIDLVQNSFPAILDNPHVVFVASFAQVQKFSMQLAQLVEALHKFTITYPITLAVFHADQLVIAQGGEVITQAWTEPMQLWRGQTAAHAASYLLWSPEAPLAAISTSMAASV